MAAPDNTRARGSSGTTSTPRACRCRRGMRTTVSLRRFRAYHYTSAWHISRCVAHVQALRAGLSECGRFSVLGSSDESQHRHPTSIRAAAGAEKLEFNVIVIVVFSLRKRLAVGVSPFVPTAQGQRALHLLCAPPKVWVQCTLPKIGRYPGT